MRSHPPAMTTQDSASGIMIHIVLNLPQTPKGYHTLPNNIFCLWRIVKLSPECQLCAPLYSVLLHQQSQKTCCPCVHWVLSCFGHMIGFPLPLVAKRYEKWRCYMNNTLCSQPEFVRGAEVLNVRAQRGSMYQINQ